MPIAADGRKPRISDGFHPKGDMRFRNGVGHRGQDIMYRKFLPTAPKHPWSSRWFEVFPRTPALAVGAGRVVKTGLLGTGHRVVIDHGHGLGTGYYHLSELYVLHGEQVRQGQPIGIVGGSPVGYGLVHLHFDVAVNGVFRDAEKWMRKWRHTPLSAAHLTVADHEAT